jgi:hypothetical protein
MLILLKNKWAVGTFVFHVGRVIIDHPRTFLQPQVHSLAHIFEAGHVKVSQVCLQFEHRLC